jgi:hypothetical protein
VKLFLSTKPLLVLLERLIGHRSGKISIAENEPLPFLQ